MTFNLKVMAKNAFLCIFMPFMACISPAKHCGGLKIFIWPHDLERSRSRSKGQVQGHGVKLLEMVQKSFLTYFNLFLKFWPATLTFNLKVMAKNAFLCIFMPFMACISYAKHCGGLKIFIWPYDLERSTSRSQGQVQGRGVKLLEMVQKSFLTNFEHILMILTCDLDL